MAGGVGVDGVGWGHVAWGAGSPRCGSAGGSCGWKHLGCCPCAERPVIASSRTLAVPDTRCEAVAAAANLKGRELDREGWKILGAAEEVGANHPPPAAALPCVRLSVPQASSRRWAWGSLQSSRDYLGPGISAVC